ncbi:glycosyltransferase [Acinetobacter sp. WCHAc060025]|uniref:glycosyltransferase n=1 Tax=Acinetobacter sp. WCHAc060025 TaxID=2518625 RepID=UPI001022D746|nr:glycosyltransferase [Acinetobacter sp. WCHAc060025]RZG76953.1 glycosyltransferase [Acinetobacter sp. WCHAc060025]
MSEIAKVYFLTSLFPKELEAEITLQSKGAIANANNTLQWNLYSGLKLFHPNIFLLNFPNIGAYPTKYKKIFVSETNISLLDKTIGKSYSFFNLVFFKHYFKYLKIRSIVKNIFGSLDENEKCIFYVYDLYPSFLRALYELKNIYSSKKIYICLIVPDLLGKTGSRETFLYNFVLNKDRTVVSNSLTIVDSFVLLSEQMKEQLPINGKKYTVVEGIYNDDLDLCERTEDSNLKILFYSGAMDERNGVLNLLKAFSNILDQDYRLVLCGDGPLKSDIMKFSEKDSRILYKGQLPRQQVLNIQIQSTLLINPRLPGQDFTKYSFPSKTMEYFASGVPTLMYKLEGVPEEYFEYNFYLTDPSIDTLKNKILEICENEPSILKDKALKARDFILTKKNARAQCEKIYNICNNHLER